MTRQWASAALALGLLAAAAEAGEAWQPVYADASISVSIDTSSLNRQGQTVSFREREILREPKLDTASMRRIQEIQYRRNADCAGRRLGMLSRAEFSEQGALMHYEASRTSPLNLEAAQTEKEFKVLEAVCGPP